MTRLLPTSPQNRTGTLPPGWRWVRLGDVCELRTGTRDPGIGPDQPFKYIDISSVDNTLKCVVEVGMLLGKDAPSRARQVVRAGDVLVATTRPNLNAVAMVPPELDDQICSTGFCVLRAAKDVLPDWLFAFVRTAAFVHSLSDLVKGALYPAVTDSQVKSQMIPLPPLFEQQRIMAILNEQMAAVERARAATEDKLVAIHALRPSLLRRAFEGGL